MEALVWIDGLIAAKLATWMAYIQARAAPLQPFLLFWLWLMVVGAYEGNDWRRQRLYAGYYRLLWLASVACLLAVLGAVALWLIAPAWLSLRTLILGLTCLGFALGWTAMAGRPVMR
jgi:hypothetical protein